MQFTTSGNRAFMSFPTVMAAMTFFTASFMMSRSGLASSLRSSLTSPAMGSVWSAVRRRCALK